MKNLMKLAAMFFAAVTMVACFPTGGPDEEQPQNKDVTFEVAVNSVGEGVATLTVSHNGAETDTWYGFVTTDTKKADLSLVYEKCVEVNAADLLTGTTKTIELTGLALGTSYKYVVFGMDAEGALYGTAGSATFATDSGRTMSVNPDWAMEYIGDQEYQGEMYANCINITVPENDATLYYYDVATVDEWALISADLYSYAEQLVPYIKSYIAQINAAYGTDYTWQDLLSQGSGMYSLGELDPGQYVTFMIGVNTDESLTRTYAVSAAFEVAEQDATPEYTAWFGNWLVSGPGYGFGTSGLEAQNVEFEIILSKYVNNSSYLLEGWAGLAIPIVASYYADYDALVLEGQLAAENVEFSDGSTANIYFVGVGNDGKMYAQGEFASLIADEQGTVHISAYEDPETGFAITQLTFVGEFSDGIYYVTDFIPGGTLTMTKLAAPAAAPLKGAAMFNLEGRLQKPATATFVKAGVCNLELVK